MRYTVVWLPFAQDLLATLWNREKKRRQAIANAADRIDLELKNDPEKKGTLRGVAFERGELPLAVLYRVTPMDRMVHVLTVKLIEEG